VINDQTGQQQDRPEMPITVVTYIPSNNSVQRHKFRTVSFFEIFLSEDLS
jgi:hypothetical protein